MYMQHQVRDESVEASESSSDSSPDSKRVDRFPVGMALVLGGCTLLFVGLIVSAGDDIGKFRGAVKLVAGRAAEENHVNNVLGDFIHEPSVLEEAARAESFGAFADNLTTNLTSRGERLCASGVRRLYHQTSMEGCRAILKTGFHHGSKGNMGSGIYFAESAQATGRKTRRFGCMLEVQVRLGHIYDVGKGVYLSRYPQVGEPVGDKLLQRGYDSVTMIDISKRFYGREFEVFFQDQIVDIIGYPCIGDHRGSSGNRTGDFINGTGAFDDPSPTCKPVGFKSRPKLADSFFAEVAM